MSGAEQPAAGEGFTWVFTIGNLATIIALGTGIAGIIAGIVRFTRGFGKTTGDLKDTLLLSNSKIDSLTDKVKTHEETTNQELKRNVERIEEIKWMMQEITKRIEENKSDISKRVDDRAREISDLDKKLDQLKEEHYRISLEIARRVDSKMDAIDAKTTRVEAKIDNHSANGDNVENKQDRSE